eukprot:148542_1
MGCCTSSDGMNESLLSSSIYHKHGIIPDIISQEPINALEVTFEDNIVTLAKQMTPTETSMTPLVSFPAENDKYYTLLCIDVDVLLKYQLHWMIVNIPGNNINKGLTLARYGGPQPKGSANHRYVFLVYEQLNGEQKYSKTYPDKCNSLARSKFKIKKFIKQYQCDQLVAANFLLCNNPAKQKKTKNNEIKYEEDDENSFQKLKQKNTGSLL